MSTRLALPSILIELRSRTNLCNSAADIVYHDEAATFRLRYSVGLYYYIRYRES